MTASGPGLEKEGNVVGKWAEFTVDATKAGKGTSGSTKYVQILLIIYLSNEIMNEYFDV